MTIHGYVYTITSQGGWNNQISSGYGSRGGTTLANFKIDGVNQAGNIREGKPGYVQIMTVIN